MSSERERLSCKQVAELAKVDPSTVRRWTAAGYIKGTQNPGPRGAYRYDRSEVERFLAGMVTAPVAS